MKLTFGTEDRIEQDKGKIEENEFFKKGSLAVFAGNKGEEGEDRWGEGTERKTGMKRGEGRAGCYKMDG